MYLACQAALDDKITFRLYPPPSAPKTIVLDEISHSADKGSLFGGQLLTLFFRTDDVCDSDHLISSPR